jgi:predicted transcriptional regulator
MKKITPKKKGIYIMTNREFFVAVQNAEISIEITEKAAELIAALDARNDKRKSADSKEKQATAARKAAVLEFLQNNEGQFARDEIAAAVELTTGQVTSACSALVKEELVEKMEIKVDKARKTAYQISVKKDT